jgi:dihydrodipicolinate synthase/N-acetylneuraminate lyase
MPDKRWFTVTAVVEVEALDEDAASHLISDAITEAEIAGLFPVGTFSARPTESPIERARRSHR